jgi:N-methylhydantoinase A
MREYERAMTTVVCALVGPVMASYLEGLERELAGIGVQCPVEVMESSGGVLPARVAARRPVCTVESGAAAGVLAAGLVGTRVGTPDVISFDMGGTTAKTGIVRGGKPTIAHDFQIGGKGSFGGARPGTGIPVKTPVIDLAEVGAGGGSVAWVDAGGAVRVGPQSAGAVPGPACYGRGGEAPTVTDANLLLGYLDPSGLAGGLRLSTELAQAAVAAVADGLDVELSDAALAIHEIANANMAAAIRMVTIQRGIDPRGFTLVAFGGAGPCHVARLAETFGIRSVIVPWGAGVASAVGLVSSEPAVEVAHTHVVDLADGDAPAVVARFAELEARARAERGDAGGPTAVSRSADVRYRGQAHELTVALPDELPDVLATIASRFRDQYRLEYGIDSDAPAQLVSLRVRVVQAVPTPRWPASSAAASAAAAPSGTRAARFPGHPASVDAPVFEWGALASGAYLRGPGLVVGSDTTVVVPPRFHAALDGARNLRLTALEP